MMAWLATAKKSPGGGRKPTFEIKPASRRRVDQNPGYSKKRKIIQNCYRCHGQGHWAKDCPRGQSKEKGSQKASVVDLSIENEVSSSQIFPKSWKPASTSVDDEHHTNKSEWLSKKSATSLSPHQQLALDLVLEGKSVFFTGRDPNSSFF